MATHEIELTDPQEKALQIMTDDFNAPLLLQSPPGNTRTTDEFLTEFIQEQSLNSLTSQALQLQRAPIEAELAKVIASGDDTTLQAVKDALRVK